MRNYLYQIMLTFFIAQAAFANQQCDEPVMNLLRHEFNIENTTQRNIHTAIVSAACKTLPQEKDIVLAAFAYSGKLHSKTGATEGKELFLSLVNIKNKQILSSYRSFIDEDAGMRLEKNSLKIDTAAYHLADGVRAFGLDISSGYTPNCGEGDIGATRTLYIRKGKNIRPILDDFHISTSMHIKGLNCSTDESESVIERFNRLISVGQNKSNGFNDLEITISSEIDDGSKSKRRPFHFKLQYDGKKYPTEKFEKSFSKWSN